MIFSFNATKALKKQNEELPPITPRGHLLAGRWVVPFRHPPFDPGDTRMRSRSRGMKRHGFVCISLVLGLLFAYAPTAQSQPYATSGVIIPVSANPSMTRPDFSAVGRLWIDGVTGNVGVGDLALYNSAVAPSSRLEVDGDAQIRGDLRFNDVNGANAVTVPGSAPAALTIADDDSGTPTTYFTINSVSKGTEIHAPLRFVGDQTLDATPNLPAGLEVTDGAGNAMLVFDTQTGTSNVIGHVPVNVIDLTDACATSVDTACVVKASVVTDGGLVVGKKTFMTGTLRVADLTDASTDVNGDVDGAVRIAGGLAVEKSLHVKEKIRVLSDEDGTSGGGGALFVEGGASVYGYVFLGKDTGHSLMLDTDFVTTANAVSIAATGNDDAGIALTSSGTNGGISLAASETVTVTGQSDGSPGSGGVTLIGGGASNAGVVKLQQNSAALGSPTDRIVVGADGGVTVSVNAGADFVLNSDGSATRIVSHNGRVVEVSKVVSITASAGTTPALATITLNANQAVTVSITAHLVFDAAPAALFAELAIGHFSGNAPEPDPTLTPPRTGVTRANFMKGDAVAGTLELLVTPDDSGGAGVSKDFVISLYAAGAAGSFTTADVTAVVRAQGNFVAMQ